MNQEQKQLLPVLQDDLSYSDDDDADSNGYTYVKPQKKSMLYHLVIFVSLLVVFTSLVLNVILVIQKHGSQASPSSAYIHAPFRKNDVLWWNTEYSGTNETEVDELWMNSIPWESGIIALRNEEAQAMNLPESQPWPWDAARKSIYIINAHHILHCVQNLYIALQEYRHNKSQSVEWPHILHCLGSIRQDTMCLADDTPRYVPFNTAHGFRPGDGQHRMCRDWNTVQKFVTAHDPCYKYIEPGNKNLSNLERFKFCSDNSKYIPTIREYFGYADDWVPSSVGA
ncbi:hypothetical protein HBI24_021490 [Parastagonospora nodorum]|nr:hypothetical protein HBH47_020530 [Parastagonospora nodorum]KAH4418697.1 hypothetical protein HBH92_035740 [Parastagonospora nodorum]KAH4442029.1 hypothetical protein HBH93_072200 [Parastagonospora nodorum]KAH4453765.1 hypothetical protein HBH91_100410 [Parastagonospora nodorum]KAH4510256.1 hypothetical protein HBH89_050730 [Parastagonospora nodorum]